jgi:hypothetical protein
MGFPFRVDNSRCAVAATGGRGSARAAISLLANIPILPEPIVVFPLEGTHQPTSTNFCVSSAHFGEEETMSNSGIADNSGTGTCPPVASQPRKGNRKSTDSSGISLIEPARVTTDFADLSDGTLLELVRPEGSGSNQFKFLSWNAGTSSIVDSFRQGGNLLVPPRLDERLHRNLNLRLPTGVGELLSARELFVFVCNLIRELIALPERSICLTAAFVLSTWFIERLFFAPYLCISGPDESGKTKLLRLLHCLCRRSVLIAGGIAPAIYPLPALLRPTILLDELQFNGTPKAQTLECWLRAGNTPGVPVVMGGQLLDSFGAKILCSRQPVVDTALASRALHISMVPKDEKHVRLLSEDSMREIAAFSQSRLLTFRLAHYREFEIRRAVEFTPRMQALAGALMLPFTEDRETMLALTEALREQDRDARLERHNEPAYLVVRALFEVCHEEKESAEKAPKVLCGHIAKRLNFALHGIGEAELDPRAVGPILKSLGLTTGRLGNVGRGIKLTSAVRARVHELAQAYSLNPGSRARFAGCGLCTKIFGGNGQSQPEPNESEK